MHGPGMDSRSVTTSNTAPGAARTHHDLPDALETRISLARDGLAARTDLLHAQARHHEDWASRLEAAREELVDEEEATTQALLIDVVTERARTLASRRAALENDAALLERQTEDLRRDPDAPAGDLARIVAEYAGDPAPPDVPKTVERATGVASLPEHGRPLGPTFYGEPERRRIRIGWLFRGMPGLLTKTVLTLLFMWFVFGGGLSGSGGDRFMSADDRPRYVGGARFVPVGDNGPTGLPAGGAGNVIREGFEGAAGRLVDALAIATNDRIRIDDMTYGLRDQLRSILSGPAF
jgi:hypothetical protein